MNTKKAKIYAKIFCMLANLHTYVRMYISSMSIKLLDYFSQKKS